MLLEKNVYLNDKQEDFLMAPHRIKAFIGGRGAGKSTILADEILQCVQTMPRGKGLLGSINLDTIYNKSLPSIKERWRMMGLRRETNKQQGHYVIGRRPPDYWPRAYNEPEDYQHVISFSNGACVELVSMYGANPGRGGNYNWMDFDESALLDKSKLDKAVSAGLRGNYHKVARLRLDKDVEVPYGKKVKRAGNLYWEIPFKDNPRYRSIRYVSSMPWLHSGKWLLELEHDPKVAFVESTALDNVEALGPDYVPDLRQRLTDLVFRVEVMNERLEQIDNCFYPYFDEAKHTYVGDVYRKDEGLVVSLDFNKGFISMIIGQMISGKLYIFDELYVKGNLKVEDLAKRFVAKYKGHNNKKVTIFGDQSGKYGTVVNKATGFSEFERVLQATGWNFYRPETGLNPPHKVKHEVLNEALKEAADTKLPPVRIHKVNCKALIMSIQNTPMTDEFKKDKRSERRTSIEQEEATHLSDCFDYLYFFQFAGLAQVQTHRPTQHYIG